MPETKWTDQQIKAARFFWDYRRIDHEPHLDLSGKLRFSDVFHAYVFIESYDQQKQENKDLDWQCKQLGEKLANKDALLSQCKRALEIFSKFDRAMSYMGGTFPQTGVVYGVNSGFPHGAEITREDFAEATKAIAALNAAGVGNE